ncbi:hypothetical protein B566_EDAN013872 [Ephemera danica]|nr:hypothetical protein B566_EDAN013872 [Ephemera danica]
MMDKGAKITERMQKREAERQLEKEKKREGENDSVGERVRYFSEVLSLKRGEIETNLDTACTLDKTALPEYFNKISDDLQQVNKFLTDSALFLPIYNIRKAQEQVQVLQQRSLELEEQLLPKKKFGFKSRKLKKMIQDDIIPCKIEDLVDSVPKKLITLQLYNDNSCGFADKEDQDLSLTEEELEGKDVVLSGLIRCKVQLPGTPSTLHMTGLRGCQVLVGPVTTSVFIDDCSDCTFAFPCQQVRIHNTKHCQFYVHVTSRSIIEDTTQVFFAPFNWDYDNIDKHFEIAGLDRNRNNWNCVDDFNWLAIDMPSPNWCEIEEQDRITYWH